MSSGKGPRAEITRQAIINSAAHSFLKDGYAHSSLNEMCAGAGVTKGAMYFHFSTKEDLALTLISEYTRQVHAIYDSDLSPGNAGLEGLIDSSFAVYKAMLDGTIARAGSRLIQEVGIRSEAARSYHREIIETFRRHLVLASTQGDVVTEIEPEALATNLVMQLRGLHVLDVGDGSEISAVLDGISVWWRIVISALVPQPRQSFFLEYLRRRSEWAKTETTT